MKPLRLVIAILLFIGASHFTFKIHKTHLKINELRNDLVEIQNIKHGLLNIEVWRDKISVILYKKIKDFNLTNYESEEINAFISDSLHKILNEVEQIIESKIKEGNVLQQIAKRFLSSLVIDIEDIRKKIPVFTALVVSEIQKPEVQNDIKKILDKNLDIFLQKIISPKLIEQKVKSIMRKYESKELKTCCAHLTSKIASAEKNLRLNTYFAIGSFSFIFLIYFLSRNLGQLMLKDKLVMLGSMLTLLLYGISLPMLGIDVRIELFTFEILEEQILFQEQILYYRDKSIFELVQDLIYQGDLQLILVGLLIFTFSILFPISKVISSLFNKVVLKNNKLINWLVFKSGKWSMADVLIVAIFMAFLSLQKIIDAQLDGMGEISKINTVSTNYTNLQEGFTFFLCFTLAGMIYSEVLKRDLEFF